MMRDDNTTKSGFSHEVPIETDFLGELMDESIPTKVQPTRNQAFIDAMKRNVLLKTANAFKPRDRVQF